MDDRPVMVTSEKEAHEVAKNRLLVWWIARLIWVAGAWPMTRPCGGSRRGPERFCRREVGPRQISQ